MKRALAALVLLCAACTSVTPHENFVNNLNSRVGRSIDIPRTDLKPTLLLSERQLQNGNVEYRYRYLGNCVQVYEVDPSTRIIKRATWEGSEKSCIAPP